MALIRLDWLIAAMSRWARPEYLRLIADHAADAASDIALYKGLAGNIRAVEPADSTITCDCDDALEPVRYRCVKSGSLAFNGIAP